MTVLSKSERAKILASIKIVREKRQQALNHKKAQQRILPKEIKGIEKEIEDLDNAIAYLKRS